MGIPCRHQCAVASMLEPAFKGPTKWDVSIKWHLRYRAYCGKSNSDLAREYTRLYTGLQKNDSTGIFVSRDKWSSYPIVNDYYKGLLSKVENQSAEDRCKNYTSEQLLQIRSYAPPSSFQSGDVFLGTQESSHFIQSEVESDNESLNHSNDDVVSVNNDSINFDVASDPFVPKIDTDDYIVKKAESQSYREFSKDLSEISSLFDRGAFETRKEFRKVMIEYKRKANEEIYSKLSKKKRGLTSRPKQCLVYYPPM